MRTLRAFAGGIIVACTLIANACAGTPSAVTETVAATLPPGEDLAPPLERAGGPQFISYTWEFDTQLTPLAYVAAVLPRLAALRLVRRNDTHLTLTRTTSGDFYQLDIELIGAPRSTNVRAVLRASPD